ncbi:hypothetical protein PHMEG_0007681 [Phytophthora megakarya]|uniref:Uncharacterized protein n=1 Tax=Phytophthora megakarya TaxID=4795 RepID=A0A225WLF6_9STRA|nr:hypothetical protein PHMEG_0007681 [Phytophthora megakarya]
MKTFRERDVVKRILEEFGDMSGLQVQPKKVFLLDLTCTVHMLHGMAFLFLLLRLPPDNLDTRFNTSKLGDSNRESLKTSTHCNNNSKFCKPTSSAHQRRCSHRNFVYYMPPKSVLKQFENMQKQFG